MPFISPGTLECAIYLYRSRKDAEAGKRTGGSGFLVEFPSEEHADYRHIYVVTNSHVIEQGFPVVRFNTKDGLTDFHDVGKTEWTPHPDHDDLAVCEIHGDIAFNYDIAPIPLSKFLPQSCQLGRYFVTPGTETYLIGRFIGHDGVQRNSPSIRFGHVAMMASEAEKIQQSDRVINGKKKQTFEQESFLVDTLTVGGYSGSPVYVYFPDPRQAVLNEELLRSGITPNNEIPELLLGVLWGTIPEYRPVLDAKYKELSSGWQVAGDTSMSGVVPAWKLRDLLLNDDDLKDQRKIGDIKFAHKQGRAKGVLLI